MPVSPRSSVKLLSSGCLRTCPSSAPLACLSWTAATFPPLPFVVLLRRSLACLGRVIDARQDVALKVIHLDILGSDLCNIVLSSPYPSIPGIAYTGTKDQTLYRLATFSGKAIRRSERRVKVRFYPETCDAIHFQADGVSIFLLRRQFALDGNIALFRRLQTCFCRSSSLSGAGPRALSTPFAAATTQLLRFDIR
ncbi:hypothetical protein F5X99DRAFT_42124 [Biscogniauxia marginata]|nr:hypothetical protein F5X99DRAFT_42124 [Biscogniauxia marginata]